MAASAVAATTASMVRSVLVGPGCVGRFMGWTVAGRGMRAVGAACPAGRNSVEDPACGGTLRPEADAMNIRMLGPSVVEVDGKPVKLAGPKQRAVLSLLAMRANAPVSTDQLIDDL